jgi:phosphoribosylaminoimidazolecarboxamide formyltransferase/IMP cyclohydrolase
MGRDRLAARAISRYHSRKPSGTASMSRAPIRRALLSVWDKTGLIAFARGLAEKSIELVSTGGTASALREAGLSVVDVAAVTGAPGILDGRVKTLHPAVHGGILARRDLDAHMATIAALGIPPIDLVVVNLYPFEATIAAGAGYDEAVEMIDIGGPAMIRAAAKNHAGVTVVTSPEDYEAVLTSLQAESEIPTRLRRQLAAKAFARTAAYDAAIARWLAGELGEPQGEEMPEQLTITAARRQRLRYGENPHQRAAFYVTDPTRGIAAAEQVQGKELSYNNLADADAALELVREFAQGAVAIVKHANPCGVAIDDDLPEAYAKALACDPVSAYGGIVALNRTLDVATAERITQLFTEVVIAPDAAADARAVLAAKPNLRLLLTAAPAAPDELMLRSLAGGLLVQERDAANVDDLELKVVTERAPTVAELADLRFAFAVCKHVRSNAIVFAKGGATVGIGAGQMSRLDSVAIAVRKAADTAIAAGNAPGTVGSVVASDAFFPFADGLEAALAAGATAVIQPGGSMRDAEVIAAADHAGAAMVFTGRRHFRH